MKRQVFRIYLIILLGIQTASAQSGIKTAGEPWEESIKNLAIPIEQSITLRNKLKEFWAHPDFVPNGEPAAQFQGLRSGRDTPAADIEILKSRIIQELLDAPQYRDLILEADKRAKEIGFSNIGEMLRSCSRGEGASLGVPDELQVGGLVNISLRHIQILRSLDEIADSVARQRSNAQIVEAYGAEIRALLARHAKNLNAPIPQQEDIRVYSDFLWIQLHTFNPQDSLFLCLNPNQSMSHTTGVFIHELVHFTRLDPFRLPNPLDFGTSYEYMKAVVSMPGSEADACRAEMAYLKFSNAVPLQAFKTLYPHFSEDGLLEQEFEPQFINVILRNLRYQDQFEKYLNISVQLEQWLQDDLSQAIPPRKWQQTLDPEDNRIEPSLARLEDQLRVSQERLSKLQARISEWRKGVPK